MKLDINGLGRIGKFFKILHGLAKFTEYRDPHYTGWHSKRVKFYSVAFAKKLKLSKKEVEIIEKVSPLHDIGKIAIPDEILLKPGPLTKEEFDVIKIHPIVGWKIIKEFGMLREMDLEIYEAAENVILYHHERWDGSGYPFGLKKEEIPLFARIVAIADVFDALTSDRPYRKAFSIEEAFEIIKNESGRHFDPKLVKIMLKNKKTFQILKIANF